MNTYTKLQNGSWGVRVQGSTKAGAMIQVTTKSGQVKTETIERVLWTGNGLSICAVASRPRDNGRGATYERGVGMVCDECGEIARKGTRCWETGCMH